MSSHRYPPAFDIALPNGGTIHTVDVSAEFPPGTIAHRIEYIPPLTPYERLVDKVVTFVASDELELSIGSDELQALDYDSGVHFEAVIRRRCELGEFILWEDKPGNGFKLQKVRP